MRKENRSQHLDYFSNQGSNQPKKNFKDRWKKIWKWLKVTLYVLLFGVTMTGCVQTFLPQYKTNASSGTGQELYLDKDEITPVINTFELTVDKNTGTVNYTQNNNSNKYLNNKDVIQNLEKQAGTGKYGTGSASSIVFLEPNYSKKAVNSIYSYDDSKYLYKHFDDTTYTSIFPTSVLADAPIYAPYADEGQTIIDYIKESMKSFNSKMPAVIADLKLQTNKLPDVEWKTKMMNHLSLLETSVNKIKADTEVELTKTEGVDNADLINNLFKNEFKKNAVVHFQHFIDEYNYYLNKISKEDAKATNTLTTLKNEQGIFKYLYIFTNLQSAVDAYDGKDSAAKNYAKFSANTFIAPYSIMEFGLNDYGLPTNELHNFKVTEVKSNGTTLLDKDGNKISLTEKQKADQLYNYDVLQALLRESFTTAYYLNLMKDINWITQAQVDAINNAKDNKTKQVAIQNVMKSLSAQIKSYSDYFSGSGLLPKSLSDKEKLMFTSYNNTVQSYVSMRRDTLASSTFKFVYSSKDNEWIPSQNMILVGAEQNHLLSWGEAWRHGPFYGIFVWPLAWVMMKLVGSIPPMSGWESLLVIIIAIIVTRLISLLFTYKSLFMQQRQQELNAKKAKIDAKYVAYKGNKMMENRKRAEIAALYKKNNINMLDPFINIIVSMPIFIAIWRIIQAIPALKSTHWLGMGYSTTSYQELFRGQWIYLIIIVVTAAVQVLSQLLPRLLSNKRLKERTNVVEKETMKKQNKTQNIVMIVFIFFTVILNVGVQVYWVIGGLWTIAQTVIVHKILISKWYKERQEKKKYKKLEEY